MDNSPTPQGPLMLLLQTIVDGQRKTDEKLDAALERMATKEDIQRLVDVQDKFASKSEVDVIRNDVEELKAQRIPQWGWPALTVIVMVIAILATHYWQ